MITVLELLENRDVSKLAKIYMERRDYYDGADMPEIANVEAGMARFIASLHDLDSSGEGGYIIIPVLCHEEGTVRLCANMYKVDDVIRYETIDESRLHGIEINTPYEDIGWLKRQLNSISRTSQSIDSYSYSWNDWSEIVEVPVIEEGLDEDGKDAVAEDIIWEMTWNGLDKEKHDERVEELEKMLSERSEETKQADASKGLSLEDLRKELGLPQKSEEEKKHDRLVMWRTAVIDAVQEARALASCKAHLKSFTKTICECN